MRIAAMAMITIVLAGAPLLGNAAELKLSGLGGGHAGLFSVPVLSLQEAKFHRVVRQRYDFSCGSAALATLLTYHYAHPVTEQQVFKYMWLRGNQQKIRAEGFSLLDIKQYLDAHGFRADGFRTTLDKLKQVAVPAIVLITDHGYHHFVVVTGLRAHQVLLADPAIGARVMSAVEFKQLWRNGIVFAITNQRADALFNAHADWSAEKLAPLGSAISRQSLSRMLFQRGPNDF